MDSIQYRPRRWGSLIDMPPERLRQAHAIMRKAIPANVVFILPYASTESVERRVWRYGPETKPARPRRPARPRKPLFDAPGGAA